MKSRWFVRHAESLSNAGFPTSTPGDIGLSDLGKQQAVEFAEQITEQPDLIVVSPYSRTLSTAEPLIAKFPDCPVVTLPIHEFTFLAPAMYAGTTERDRSAPANKYWMQADPDFCDDGAESFRNFITRIGDTFDEICARPEQHIITFSHGYVIKALAWMLLNQGQDINADYMTRFHGFRHAQIVFNTHLFPFVKHPDGKVSLLPTIPPLRPVVPTFNTPIPS